MESILAARASARSVVRDTDEFEIQAEISIQESKEGRETNQEIQTQFRILIFD